MTASGGKWAESSETMSVFIAGATRTGRVLLEERFHPTAPVTAGW
jgi:hypothetical protein